MSLLRSSVRVGVRYLGNASDKDVSIEELKKLIAQKPGGSLELFDVREPHEYADGFIPTAVNVPCRPQWCLISRELINAVGEIGKALSLSNADFQRKYGVAKPSKDNKDVIFYCKAGVRSANALVAAQGLGYKNARNFRGSWLQWLEHHK